jgi:ketosteroid isomerase-like protein
MSHENVEIERRAFDNFNRRELATAVEAFDPDAEWIPYLAALEEHTYRGRERIEAMWREVLGDFPDFRIELMEVVTDRGDIIVFKVEFQGMGRASGADTPRRRLPGGLVLRRESGTSRGLPRSSRGPRSRRAAVARSSSALRRSRLGGRGLIVRDKPQLRPVQFRHEDRRLPLSGQVLEVSASSSAS